MAQVSTRGQAALSKALDSRIEEKTGRAWLAERLGITQSAVSRWCTGDGRPDPHFRRAIAAFFDIPQEAWDTAEEAGIVRAAERIGSVKYAQTQRTGKVSKRTVGQRPTASGSAR